LLAAQFAQRASVHRSNNLDGALRMLSANASNVSYRIPAPPKNASNSHSPQAGFIGVLA
jgi:hypothetical protein